MTATKAIQCPDCGEVFDVVDFDPADTELQTECACGKEIPFEDNGEAMLTVMQFEDDEEEDNVDDLEDVEADDDEEEEEEDV